MDKKITSEEKIRNLVALAKELGLSSLSVEDEEAGISFEIGGVARTISHDPKETKVMEKETEADESKGTYVVAPFDGIYYNSPSPDSPVFVVDGSKVSNGDTLCIIEAMKVMNEIQGEGDGVVLKVLKSNGDQVLKGDPLFLID
ncbi:MAG: acetyl-CoA carboxylase, biotin carboxyl carrier protein [Caldisericia bacterium]|nr:acetyl-CoA carboxylase, biotin carboxyl carrier protein [Caldisericia bacterium]